MRQSGPVQKPTRYRVAAWILTAIQCLAVIGAYLLHDLSLTKAGVNHHVRFRKQQYLQTVLREDRVFFYQILIGLILVALIIHLLRHRDRKTLGAWLTLLGLTSAVGLGLSLQWFKDLPAYPYLLLIAVVVWSIEWAKLGLRSQKPRS